MAFKLVISDPKSGRSVQKEAADEATKGFFGLKIGDLVKGELIDLHGYEFLLTGGSDFCGFPMRRDVQGVGRKKILAYRGVGIKKDKKGILQRKTVCGNTIHAKISQVNLKVTKYGTDNIFAAKEKSDKEVAHETKEKSVAEAAAKPQDKKEEKPAPKAKPEPKAAEAKDKPKESAAPSKEKSKAKQP